MGQIIGRTRELGIQLRERRRSLAQLRLSFCFAAQFDQLATHVALAKSAFGAIVGLGRKLPTQSLINRVHLTVVRECLVAFGQRVVDQGEASVSLAAFCLERDIVRLYAYELFV